jgi:hypothetical protein
MKAASLHDSLSSAVMHYRYQQHPQQLDFFFLRDETQNPNRFETTQEAINTRMSSPNISTILDTDSIAFTKYVYVF